MNLKTCSKCKKELPVSQFWKSKTSSDGLYCYCKSCASKIRQQYQKDNPEKIREYSKRHWKKYRQEKINGDRLRMYARQEFLDTLKSPCVKCGESRPYIIQFHHVDPSTKTFAVASGAAHHKTKDEVVEEAKKCVCLCANCHKEFHYLYGLKSKTPVDDLKEYLNGGGV